MNFELEIISALGLSLGVGGTIEEPSSHDCFSN